MTTTVTRERRRWEAPHDADARSLATSHHHREDQATPEGLTQRWDHEHPRQETHPWTTSPSAPAWPPSPSSDPRVGIGILAGMSSSAIGRNPDAASSIRGLAIILAAFAEGLGVLAIVIGLLIIFLLPGQLARRPCPAWPSPRGRPNELVRLAAEGGEAGGLTINFFWIIVAATNFIVFFYIAYKLVLVPVGERLVDRRERIEQGLKDCRRCPS